MQIRQITCHAHTSNHSNLTITHIILTNLMQPELYVDTADPNATNTPTNT